MQRRVLHWAVFLVLMVSELAAYVSAQSQSQDIGNTDPASPVPSATQEETDTPASSPNTISATSDPSGLGGTEPVDMPTATNEDGASESMDESYEETGLPGAVILSTPDYVLYPSPMFEIGSSVVLGWSYSNATLRPPEKVSICGRYPPDNTAFQERSSVCDWEVVSNLTGGALTYTWNTLTQGAPGYTFYADSGYMMYIFDGDYGASNPNPGAGRTTPFVFSFAMYNSQYGNTNQGVPVGYNPSAAPTTKLSRWAVLAAGLLGIFSAVA